MPTAFHQPLPPYLIAAVCRDNTSGSAPLALTSHRIAGELRHGPFAQQGSAARLPDGTKQRPINAARINQSVRFPFAGKKRLR